MIFGIITRTEKKENCNRLFITSNFKNIFDKLNITLFPITSGKNIDKIANLCDALIVPGSNYHINPKYYEEKPIDDIEYNIDEFKLDRKVIQCFANLHKPILGICAGIQSINVTFGGTLKQRIENHFLEELHDIHIKKNTFLYDIYKTTTKVNSYHVQAIDNVAKDFKVTALAKDNVIEAIEKDNIIGIQWHPEKQNDIIFFQKFIEKYVNTK